MQSDYANKWLFELNRFSTSLVNELYLSDIEVLLVMHSILTEIEKRRKFANFLEARLLIPYQKSFESVLVTFPPPSLYNIIIECVEEILDVISEREIHKKLNTMFHKELWAKIQSTETKIVILQKKMDSSVEQIFSETNKCNIIRFNSYEDKDLHSTLKEQFVDLIIVIDKYYHSDSINKLLKVDSLNHFLVLVDSANRTLNLSNQITILEKSRIFNIAEHILEGIIRTRATIVKRCAEEYQRDLHKQLLSNLSGEQTPISSLLLLHKEFDKDENIDFARYLYFLKKELGSIFIKGSKKLINKLPEDIRDYFLDCLLKDSIVDPIKGSVHMIDKKRAKGIASINEFSEQPFVIENVKIILEKKVRKVHTGQQEIILNI